MNRIASVRNHLAALTVVAMAACVPVFADPPYPVPPPDFVNDLPARDARYTPVAGVADYPTLVVFVTFGSPAGPPWVDDTWVAERVFGELPYDAFLVEWDDLGRDGGFEPVRYLRKGSTMVMGIVSTKTPVLEAEDDLLRKMDVAAGFVGGMDRLAISPQCGFASVMVGNEIDEGTQWRKLELVARIADRLWG